MVERGKRVLMVDEEEERNYRLEIRDEELGTAPRGQRAALIFRAWQVVKGLHISAHRDGPYDE